MMLGSDADSVRSDLAKVKVLAKQAVSMLHSGAVYTADVVAIINNIEDTIEEIQSKFN